MPDSNRLTKKKKRGSRLYLEGTTKYPYTHKHNSRHNGESIYCAYCLCVIIWSFYKVSNSLNAIYKLRISQLCHKYNNLFSKVQNHTCLKSFLILNSQFLILVSYLCATKDNRLILWNFSRSLYSERVLLTRYLFWQR